MTLVAILDEDRADFLLEELLARRFRRVFGGLRPGDRQDTTLSQNQCHDKSMHHVVLTVNGMPPQAFGGNIEQGSVSSDGRSLLWMVVAHLTSQASAHESNGPASIASETCGRCAGL